MNIDELIRLIKDGLKEGKYSLDTTLLTSPAITQVAKDYLPSQILKLVPDPNTPFTYPPDGRGITVHGVGMDAPFSGMTMAATFYLLETGPRGEVEGEPALTLIATGNQDWTLANAFETFSKNIGKTIRFQGNPAPTFSLLSHPQNGKPAGLTFDGVIDFAIMNVGIATLLGIPAEPISGPIVLAKGATDFVSMALTGPNVNNVNLWLANNLPVTFSVGANVITNSITKTSRAIPYIELAAKIPFSSSGREYHLPVAVRTTNWKSAIRFSADVTEVVDATLDALSSFVHHADLSKTLPPPGSFKLEEVARFKALYLDINPAGQSVSDVGLEIVSTGLWKIVELKNSEKALTAENVRLRFVVLKPFSAPDPYLNLSGDIHLTDTAVLHLSASYPGFEVSGYLSGGLNIKEFIEQFAGPCAGVPEGTITVLSFSASASGNYSFAATIDGFWPINPGQNFALIVNELGFAIKYATATGVLKAQFSGSLTVGSIDVAVTAAYTTNEGWTFTGKTGEGQKIKIGEFITYATQTFKVPPPPDWIRGITLQDLATDFNTKTKNFHFGITCTIPLAEAEKLVMRLTFGMEAVEGGYEKKLGGDFTIGTSLFKMVISNDPEGTTFTASWEAKGEEGYLQFEDIARAFGFKNPPPVPDALKLGLKKAALFYDFNGALVLSAESVNFGNSVFVAKKFDAEWKFVFGIEISPEGIDLAHLPLVGKDLAALGPIGLKTFKLVVAPTEVLEPEVDKLNELISKHAGRAYPTLPKVTGGVPKGAYLAVDLNLGKDNSYELEFSTATRKQAQLMAVGATGGAEDSNVKWISLQKTIGPVYFDRAGVAFQDGKIALMLDASLTLASLKISLVELGASMGVSTPLGAPTFGLNGLAIAYESGPVRISGGFLKFEKDGVTQYVGSATIGVPAFNLSALGAYASVEGQPSLFIFAMLTKPPLGGPPAFFVTGVAAGFGYNRGLRLPGIDDVTTFPLVSGFVPGQSSPFSGNDPGAALKVLIDKDVVPVRVGQNWLAAGVQFTSFQTIEAYVLLSVSFGTKLEIGLLGLASISVPPKSPTALAYAELALAVSILPDDGIVSVDAKLTPASFVLSKRCYLTGGFAFYLWFAPNTHEGDFVVTLGGYHPNFSPPAHYPRVPRLGFNWAVTPQLSIKGGMYFALTPTCLMAGGSLEATFQSGDLKAWFAMGANFLIAWKPFHYEAQMYLGFGVSYTFRLNLLFTTITKTISISLGADLTIWGPEFSGVARIDLWIISFTVSFGATPKGKPRPIPWKEFQESFLPPSPPPTARQSALLRGGNVHSTTYCSSKVTAGLVRDLSRDGDIDGPLDWIVNGDGTTLETNTIIPAKEYTLTICDKTGFKVPPQNIVITNPGELAGRNKDFGLGLVEVENKDFSSAHAVTLTMLEGRKLNPDVKYQVTAVLRSVPKALWEKGSPSLSNEATIDNALIGFDIRPLSPDPDASLPIALENFQYRSRNFVPNPYPAHPKFVIGPDLPDPMHIMQTTIDDITVRGIRADILGTLKRRGILEDTAVEVSPLAAHGNEFLLAAPVLAFEYWKKP